MNQPVQEKLVDAVTTVPFISLFGYNFMTLNELLETTTLCVGLIAAIFSLFFHIRRYFRGRKRDRAVKSLLADD